MSETCPALDIYDPEDDGDALTEWGRKAFDVSHIDPYEVSAESSVFRRFCDIYEIEDPDSITSYERRMLVAVCKWLHSESISLRCPHEPIGEEESRCLFHLPPERYDEHSITEQEITECFLDSVSAVDETPSEARWQKCLVRAKFEQFDLSSRTFSTSDRYPVNLQFSQIETLKLDDARIGESLILDHSDIETISADHTQFERRVSIQNARIDSEILMKQARFFGSEFTLRGSRFEGTTLDLSKAEFNGTDLNFESFTFVGRRDEDCELLLYRASVNGADATFERARFGMTGLAISINDRESPTPKLKVWYKEFPASGANIYAEEGSADEEWIGRTDANGRASVPLDVDYDGDILVQWKGLEEKVRVDSGQHRPSNRRVNVDLTRFSIHGGDADFDHCEFHGTTSFKSVRFEGAVTEFFDSTFYHGADFRHAILDVDEIRFQNAWFGSPMVDFEESKLSADRINFKIDGTLTTEFAFDSAVFSGNLLEFDNAEIVAPERISFDNCRFDSTTVQFDEVTFRSDDVAFTKIDGRYRAIDFTQIDSDSPLRFAGSSIPAGTIVLDETSSFTFDFERATIGDIKLRGNTAGELLHRFRFLDTEFDGFDFKDAEHHRSFASAEWNIHQFEHDPSTEPRLRRSLRLLTDGSNSDAVPGPARLESTYMKAKIGAEIVGDTGASSQFFRKELQYRRRKHGQLAWSRGRPLQKRFRDMRRWTYNYVLGVTTGYGEEPRRVVGASVVVILAFMVGYSLLWSAHPASPPGEYEGLLGSLVLSLESFTALVLSPAVIEPVSLRIIAYFQGFLGAFLIALFVFALTRAIRR